MGLLSAVHVYAILAHVQGWYGGCTTLGTFGWPVSHI